MRPYEIIVNHHERGILQEPTPPVERFLLFLNTHTDSTDSSPLNIQDETLNFERRLNILFKQSVNLNPTNKVLFDNIIGAVSYIKSAYDDKLRRTGEPSYMHPLRVLVRGLAELPSEGPQNMSTLGVSLLSCILHDAKEDFKDFSISLLQGPGEDVHQLLPSHSEVPYLLHLTPGEKRLLDMQIEACTIPPDIDNSLPSLKTTAIQINHLLDMSIQISEEFRPFAAYQTLLVKIRDRVDNVCTHYERGSEDDGKKLRKKLLETILYFSDLEIEALCYSRKAELTLPERRVSAVALCRSLINAEGYNKLFLPQIEEYRKNSPSNIFQIPSTQ